VLSETAEVMYKCDAFYHKDAEAGIAYNDASLNIDWQIPADKMIISDKDLVNPTIANCKNNFVFGG
jgi:dTDP-4-dehydrorhamnose 3,5-epimerase